MLEPGKIYEIHKDLLEDFSFIDARIDDDKQIRFMPPRFETGDKVLILREETNIRKSSNEESFYWVFNLTQGRKMGLCIYNTEDSFSEERLEEIEF